MNAEVEGLPLLRTGMAESLLQEVARLLERLAGSGETSAIDLRSLPMTEGDRNELAERLGSGEVRILFDVAGTSEAWETAYAGVWWVRHLGRGRQGRRRTHRDRPAAGNAGGGRSRHSSLGQADPGRNRRRGAGKEPGTCLMARRLAPR